MVNFKYLYNHIVTPFSLGNGTRIKEFGTIIQRATTYLEPAGDNFVKEMGESGAKAIEPFNPKTGGKLNLHIYRQRALVNRITPNKESQNLILRMINNEAVVVTPEVEKYVMKTQFETYMRTHKDVNPDNIYIFSPKPKGETKSYTRSGEIFAGVNNVDKTRIKEDFIDIPENSVVFMPDDCSITGASMVFDLLDKLPPDFKGNIVFAPTVKGVGRNLKNNEMAEEVLDSLSLINKKATTRDKVITRLINLISDNKKRNIEILEKLRTPENYNNLHVTIAEGSLPAKNFRKTETFKSMPKHEQAIVDKLFTAEGINKGYHDSGVMVLLPHKTPNNNVGIMNLFGKELGLSTKPNGIIDYSETIKLAQENKKCAIGIVPSSNKKGNYSKLYVELPNSKTSTISIPHCKEAGGRINVSIRLKNGELRQISYLPKLEEKAKIGKERQLGFEVPEGLSQYIKALKGEYQPKTVDKDYGYFVDVLAIPKDAKIESINDIKLNDLISQSAKKS